MSPQESFEALKKFLAENRPAQTALALLTPGSEIGIEVAEMLVMTIANRNGKAELFEEKAANPLVIVHAKPQTIEQLVQAPPSASAAELGEILMKEYLTGNIQVDRVATWKSLIDSGCEWLCGIGFAKAADFLKMMKP